MKNINIFNKPNFERATESLKEKIEKIKEMLVKDVKECENAYQELVGIIDEIDSLEVYKAVMLEDLKEKHEEYLKAKDNLSKRKADKFFGQLGELSEDINRLLQPNEVEKKVKTEIKRNTTKKNLNRRTEELKIELAELQDKNAKGILTSEELTRYYMIPEILKEFDNVSI